MNVKDFEIFKFSENKYTKFYNNGKEYLLNKSPYLDIVLTDYCNSNCSFCIADLIHNKLNADIDIFKEKILYAIENMNVKEVLLLGGEPTMSKILIPITKWLSDLGLDKIVITTNGIRLAKDKEFRMELFKSGITHINISYMNIIESENIKITNNKYSLSNTDLKTIYQDAKNHNINLRINTNVFWNNNDTIPAIESFYNYIRNYCDSVKFSPLLATDSFSVVDVKTDWVKNNRLDDDYTYDLFEGIQTYFSRKYNLSIIENDLQFGFVKNTMIPLRTPIILNWNFGKYTGMMDKVVNESKINNIKLLPNNELSLSWNRELPEYFIKTN